MEYMLKIVTASALSYLLGCFNAAYLYSTKIKHTDIRQYGSGNAGSTNILRVFGFKSALPVFLVDVFKGFLAVTLTKWLSNGYPVAVFLSAFFVVVGHNWPIFMNYRGGKGIATSVGVLLALDYRLGLLIFGIAVIVILISKMVSLGSIVGLVIMPLIFWLFHEPAEYIVITIVLAVLALYQHRSNLIRIIKGEESKIGSKKNEQK